MTYNEYTELIAATRRLQSYATHDPTPQYPQAPKSLSQAAPSRDDVKYAVDRKELQSIDSEKRDLSTFGKYLNTISIDEGRGCFGVIFLAVATIILTIVFCILDKHDHLSWFWIFLLCLVGVFLIELAWTWMVYLIKVARLEKKEQQEMEHIKEEKVKAEQLWTADCKALQQRQQEDQRKWENQCSMVDQDARNITEQNTNKDNYALQRLKELGYGQN